MNDLVQANFNYSMLDAADAIALQLSAERIKMRMRRTAEDIIAIGQELISAKNRLPHGQFLDWLQKEFGMSQPSASRFMMVANKFEDKVFTVNTFSPTVLYLLASENTPESVVDQVTSGEIDPTAKKVKEAIADAKAEVEAERQKRITTQQQLMEAQTVLSQQEREMTAAQQRALIAEQALNDLEVELAAVQVPQEIVREVATPDPRQADRIAALEKQIAQVTDQHQQAVQRVMELQKHAEQEAAKSYAGENERRMRLEWFSARSEMLTYTRKILGLLPSQQFAQIFEPDDWQMMHEVISTFRRAVNEIELLMHSQGSVIIDASEEVA